MLLNHLTLRNFRNLAEVGLPLPPGRTIIHGENAQGKSNLLEAIYVFAVSRSIRAGHERDVVSWASLTSEIPYAHLRGLFERGEARLEIDIVVQLTRPPGHPGAGVEQMQYQKRVKVNGVVRRAGALVGEVLAVLFEPQDIELVYGSPPGRRRHLDITLCQADTRLLRELQRYNRVLAQRNPLLKAVREGQASREELAYWDDELVEAGAYVTQARHEALDDLNRRSAEIHRDLTDGEEDLAITYQASIGNGEGSTESAFRRRLAEVAEREVLQGATLVGPHRDDFSFAVNGRDLAAFGSRGQQRLATLALKLAEARYLRDRTGEEPVLLLDDVLSELDPPRRGYLMHEVNGYGQAILTTADLGSVDPALKGSANLVRVAEGRVEAG